MRKSNMIRYFILLISVLSVLTVKAENQFCQQQKTGYYRFNIKLSLKDNIKRMTKQAGWQLVWRYPADLPVLANSSFSGILFCQSGVLARVINSITKTDNFGAIGISFDTRNRVVLISSNPRALSRGNKNEY
ncbi:MAG: TcpQ domain-containing protein [Enterobacterales bacterium]|nr:TcpQ domain-containing protein [Enterobacterales bacterium]